MSISVLDNKLWFPHPNLALPDGLLAMGGDISVERILLAYKKGIFPWYDGTVPLWWSPNPRFVLFPHKLKISKSMQQLFKKQAFTVTINSCFEQVIKNCMHTKRKDQEGSWINNDIIQTYSSLHKMNLAHSVEVWDTNQQLVGGLYGVQMGKLFFGESMFSLAANASKYGFITFVTMLIQQGIELIDCQVYTEHLESLGAEMIDRNLFLHYLQQNGN